MEVVYMENLASYSPMAFHMVSHVLTLGYAAMFAALLYFVLTLRFNSPKYRMSSILSVVVMVSAALLLFAQTQAWDNGFTFSSVTGMYERTEGANLFTNGFRYLNWLIDVPMLLFQILFVVTITGDKFRSYRNQFFISGPLMILTGYIGQFYETTNLTQFLLWGTLSTAFFVHVLILIYRIIQEGKQDMPAEAQGIMSTIWWVFLISWFLYPGAYLAPLIGGLETSQEWAVVGRQITYTVADIVSKIVYGVLLNVVSTIRSNHEGYDLDKVESGATSNAA